MLSTLTLAVALCFSLYVHRLDTALVGGNFANSLTGLRTGSLFTLTPHGPSCLATPIPVPYPDIRLERPTKAQRVAEPITDVVLSAYGASDPLRIPWSLVRHVFLLSSHGETLIADDSHEVADFQGRGPGPRSYRAFPVTGLRGGETYRVVLEEYNASMPRECGVWFLHVAIGDFATNPDSQNR